MKAKKKEPAEVIQLYESMEKESIQPNDLSRELYLNACLQTNDYPKAEHLFEQMEKANIRPARIFLEGKRYCITDCIGDSVHQKDQLVSFGTLGYT
jgi:pentatricopeptide repeat protein